jgi:hypothetical protein
MGREDHQPTKDATMTTVIHIDPDPLIHVLDERGWTKGAYGDDSPDAPVCLHGAVRLCAPVPGDAQIIEQVANRQWDRGTDWNDRNERSETDVREFLSAGLDVTDEDLLNTFGPQWSSVVEIVRTAVSATPDQIKALRTAPAAAATYAAAYTAYTAHAAYAHAAYAAAADAAAAAAYAPADPAAYAARACAVWHLATEDGPFTFAHRETLIAPWRSVFGLPAGLEEA